MTDEPTPLSNALQAAVQSLSDGDLGAAQERVQTALGLDDAHADAWHLEGVIAYRRGDLVRAGGALRRAIEADPMVAAYHVNLGNVLRAADDRAGAEAAYRRALELDPFDARTCCNLGGLLSSGDRVPEAMVAYRDAIARDPSVSAGYQGLLWCLQTLGRNDEVPEVAKRWQQACPDEPLAH